MTRNFSTIVLLSLAGFALCLFGSHAPTQAQTTEPKFEYLMTYKALLEPAYKADDTLYIFNVLPGGWVKGPAISGTFVPPGGDWLRAMPSGAYRLDVRATIKTDDGDLLYITYNGVVDPTEEYMTKFKNGEKYTHEDKSYFVTAPTIQTSSKKYDYLNRVQLINKFVEGRQSKDDSYVMYDVFIVR